MEHNDRNESVCVCVCMSVCLSLCLLEQMANPPLLCYQSHCRRRLHGSILRTWCRVIGGAGGMSSMKNSNVSTCVCVDDSIASVRNSRGRV